MLVVGEAQRTEIQPIANIKMRRPMVGAQFSACKYTNFSALTKKCGHFSRIFSGEWSVECEE